MGGAEVGGSPFWQRLIRRAGPEWLAALRGRLASLQSPGAEQGWLHRVGAAGEARSDLLCPSPFH